MAQIGDGPKSDLKSSNAGASNAVGAGQGGIATKGRFDASSTEEEELGWGVVRLYKDGEETPSLYDEPAHGKGSKSNKALVRKQDGEKPAFKDEDCTTLCILAVPSYLTPSDFLGFVGEKTREEVSHFRMIKTEKSNRYMVLMKFRNGRRAREWRKEWNGKAFDGLEVYLHLLVLRTLWLTSALTARELSRRLRQINRLPHLLDLLSFHIVPRHDQRPFHTFNKS